MVPLTFPIILNDNYFKKFVSHVIKLAEALQIVDSGCPM